MHRKQYIKDTKELIDKAGQYNRNKGESVRYAFLRDAEKANPTPEYMTKDTWKGIDAVKEYDRLSNSYSGDVKEAQNYYKSYLDKYGKMPVGAKSFGGSKASRKGFKELERDRKSGKEWSVYKD